MKIAKVTPTALQEARVAFDKLVALSKKRMPAKPQGTVSVFAVATLPSGNVLMSNGQIKVPAAMKKVEKVQRQTTQAGQVGGTTQLRQIIEDLSLQAAVPQNQMGTGMNKAVALANYVNAQLRPQMQTQPAFGRTITLPQPESVSKFYAPSAFANLPPLVRRVEDVLRTQLNRVYRDETQRIQQAFAADFLKKFTTMQRPGANAAVGSLGPTPRLSKEYESKNYYIQPNREAQTASIAPQSPPLSSFI